MNSKFNQETQETWNVLAELYEEKFMHLELYNESYDRFCASISKEGANILELGCGPGNVTRYLLHKRPDVNILATDFASNMVSLAAKNNPTATTQVLDARDLRSLDSTFDGIIAGFCLPYLSPIERKKLIDDCYDLLNENGTLYLSFVEGDEQDSGFQTGSNGLRSYFYFHNLHDLKNELIQSHFNQPQVFKVDYNRTPDQSEMHTIVIAKKPNGNQ